MMVIMTCSLIVNGPGLSDTPMTAHLGTNLAQAWPIGKESSWATIPVMVTDGYRK